MMVTVTMNPALDKTAELDQLQAGKLNRLRSVVTDAGGKGVNVSRVIAALGGESVATGFVGGGSGEEIVRSLEAQNIRTDFVRVQASTRTNLKVLDRGSRLTELNEPGGAITWAEQQALLHKLEGYASPDTLFIFAGSLPPGVDAGIYANLIRMVHQKGARAFLDADGDAFRLAVESRPDFIKPNTHELLEYTGEAQAPPLPGLAALCRRLMAGGIPQMALSMGEKGALFINESQALYADALSVNVHSTVGAGDSMVAAFAYAAHRRFPFEQAAALSMAASAGAVTTIGTKPPDRRLVDRLLQQVKLIPVAEQ